MLECCSLPVGTCVIDMCAPFQFLHFPTSFLFPQIQFMSDRQQQEEKFSKTLSNYNNKREENGAFLNSFSLFS